MKNKRNELGLLDGFEYKYHPDGLIAWRSIVDPKYLYPNRDNFIKRKEEVPTSIENLKDSDLVLALGGIKELSSIRGFTSVTYRPIVAGVDYAAVTCQIQWIGNYETDMIPVTFEECGSASIYNTSELVQSYLLEIACNRAYCRCVRNFLKINIVSDKELPPAKKPISKTNGKIDPANVLATLMKEKGRLFKEVKEKLLAEGDLEFQDFNDWNDIPGDKAFSLIDRFKNLKESRK